MKTISRTALFEDAWTRPLTRIAAEFGVSDTALRKMCDRHDIPTPGRGYWARIASGQTFPRPQLRPAKASHLEMVRIVGAPQPSPEVRALLAAAKAQAAEQAPVVSAPSAKAPAHTANPKLGFIYQPSRTLTAPFVALQGGRDEACLPAATHAFMSQVPHGRVIDLPRVGHGYSVPANWASQFAQTFASLYPAARSQPTLRAAPQAADPRLAQLPLTALAAAGAGDTLAVFYSGDGGWAGIDQEISSGFVRAGIPVVGYDSLRYFWSARTPQGAAADLTAVLRHYMAAWGKSRILLTSYSFGADALPAIIPHLPPDPA